jgi:putative ATP-dependent endonuclease of OLD family
MGIALVNAETDSQIAPLGAFYKKIGKNVFAIFDKQSAESLALITSAVDYPFESPEKGFENLMIKQTSESSLRRHATAITPDWPPHLISNVPTTSGSIDEIRKSLSAFFQWTKGDGGCSDLLAQCTLPEMPEFIIKTMDSISAMVNTESKTQDAELKVV